MDRMRRKKCPGCGGVTELHLPVLAEAQPEWEFCDKCKAEVCEMAQDIEDASREARDWVPGEEYRALADRVRELENLLRRAVGPLDDAADTMPHVEALLEEIEKTLEGGKP